MKILRNLEELAYGNLDAESFTYMGVQNIFTNYLDVFTKNPYPNLVETESEIDEVIKTQKEFMEESPLEKYKVVLRKLDPTRQDLRKKGTETKKSEFWEFADEDIQLVFRNEFRRLGIPYTKKYAKYLEDIQTELGALVMQLKSYYNRARPYQLAYYTGQPLHPFQTKSGNTPAYPSGHSCQGRFLMKVVASHYPKKEMALKRLADNIGQSRIYMGVHYPSDAKFGNYIADQLATFPLIRKKFFRG